MFERFTERAKRTIVLAREEAIRVKNPYLGTEHILLGLIRKEDGTAVEALKKLGLDLKEIRFEVERRISRHYNRRIENQVEIPFTSRAKKVLELAIEEANMMGHDRIGIVEQQRQRGFPLLDHLPQHPRGRHAAFGRVQHQDTPHITLAVERMGRPGEHSPVPVEIVARAEIVRRHQRQAAHSGADALVSPNLGQAHAIILPAIADATQRSIEAGVGL